jgi:PAS domain S-box-containing protein
MNDLYDFEKLSLLSKGKGFVIRIIDREGRIIWANERFSELSGYSLDEVSGKLPQEFLFGPETDLLNAKEIEDKIKNAEYISAEQLIYSKEGQPYWVQMDISPVEDKNNLHKGFIVFETDITNRKIHEKKILRNWSEYDDIFEEAIMPMCFTDTQGIFIRVNQAYCNLFECKRDDLLGKSILNLQFNHLPESEKTEFIEESQKLLQNQYPIQKEYCLKTQSGKQIYVEIIRKLVEVNGKQAISAYLADVTEKRDIQNRILEQNKRLKEFAFITSHKIRQPLANILGLIELVKSESHSGQDVTITLETLRMLTGQLDGVVHEMGQALAELDVDIEKSLFYNGQEEKRIQNVWIVDDDQVITYITTRLMKNADPAIKISEFTSAKMALEKLRLDPSQPDILLLDINMPGISGWQFLEEMQAMHRFVNVYMYSSSIDPEDVKKARSYPMVRDFLSKPFDMETVRHLLSIPLIRSQVS